MNTKLMEVLKKAKEVEKRARNFDNGNKQDLIKKAEASFSHEPVSSLPQKPTLDMYESTSGMDTYQQPAATPKVDVGGEVYKKRVMESKLPPEVRQAMLDNPIQQPDAPGTFSLDEDTIKEINPNYGKQINESPVSQPTLENVRPTKKKSTVNSNVIRKMIQEEIGKALPSIVEKYFDKKMIQENIRTLKKITIK
tara:strand:- start:3317 stop:3901 length:585 start_codon:yes stop_codon:yes gene_type:complete